MFTYVTWPKHNFFLWKYVNRIGIVDSVEQINIFKKILEEFHNLEIHLF